MTICFQMLLCIQLGTCKSDKGREMLLKTKLRNGCYYSLQNYHKLYFSLRLEDDYFYPNVVLENKEV